MAQVLAVPATMEQRMRSSNARSRRIVDSIATVALWLAASIVVLLLLLFIGYEFVKGASAISWHFLTSAPSSSEAGGGVGPLIFNSFYLLILTLIFTVPISTAAGVYLHEYSKPGRFRELVVFSAESLATMDGGLFHPEPFGLIPRRAEEAGR